MMKTTREKNVHAGSTRRGIGKQVQKFHALLNSEDFMDFLQPVSARQVQEAIQFLDRKFGRWNSDVSLAAWGYVLPAIHQLFPEQKRFGFTAPFVPKQSLRESWHWIRRCAFGPGTLANWIRRESPHAR